VTKGRLLFWLLIAAFLWLLVSRMGEIEKTAEPLVRGQIDWILAAAILQVLYYAVFACMFKSAFYTVGVESRIRDLLPVTFGALFVNVVAPTWGMAGAALYIDDAAHRGESPARAAAGTLLAQTADFTSFALILGGGVAYLLIRHRLRGYEIFGTLVLLAILCSLALSLILALWRPVILKRMMFSAQNIINSIMLRIRRPAILSDGWAEKNASDFSMAAGAIKDRPK
jgi:uncharacterized membrane protein YbhN (UPF0104 family)